MTQYCHSTKRTGSQLRAQQHKGCLGFAFVFFEEKLDPQATFRELGMLPDDVLSVTDRHTLPDRPVAGESKQVAGQPMADAASLRKSLHPELHGEGQPTARDLWEKAKERGDPTALRFEAWMRLSGTNGMPRNHSEAARKFRDAAALGDLPSAFNLAVLCSITRGQPQRAASRDAEAVSWLRKAGTAGDAESQAALGMRYARGEGVPQEAGAAVSWLRRAAEQGSPRGLYYLGLTHDKGHGVARDVVKAIGWYTK